jgi:CDP-6-deoxy-D-xylo-4-hexulose-3-dehydrase
LSCDLNDLEKIFKENQEEKPLLFISVSPLGIVPKMKQLLDLCKKYNVELLEDNCESMGSKYDNKMLGTFGLASVYSMYFGHHISTIEGGLINTNDDELNTILLSMRSHGWNRDLSFDAKQNLKKEWNTSDFDELYCFYYPGLNLRSTDVQAFIGLRAIEKLDFYSEVRNRNFFHYKNLLKNNELNLEIRENSFISNLGYPIIHKKRNDIIKELQENHIEVRPLIAGSIANKPFWIKRYGKSIFPNADIVDKYGFYLPNHQDLSFEDISFITDIINKF